MSHQDLKTIIIHKKQDKKPQINPSQVGEDGKKIFSGKNSQGPSFNAASVERKIDSGEMGAPQTIPKEVSQKIINARREKGIKTQKDLATMTSIPVTDINQMESGKFVLTPQNKQKIRKVTNYLKLGSITL
jgi:ribosome-binding protein aMBF1 (putative translation factor)